ncbi:MAG: LuxR C-terminal-related transcriptional regulator [Solirubrobacteraceae bacterium]
MSALPPEADASEAGFVVARTKLSIPLPRARSRIVARPHLLELLDEGLSARVTLMSGPTGWGKTTAVAEWATARDAQFAWVSLDSGDNESLRFWRCVVTSLVSVAPGSSSAMRRLQSPVVSLIDEILPALINDLAEVAGSIVLVIDDYHVIVDPGIHAQLEYLISRLPLGIHVVLVGHAEPPLRLGRMRAIGEVADIGPEQLRFTDQEAEELLNRVHRLDLRPEEVRAVQLRIEGWVAGLNLAALSLKRGENRGRGFDALPADDRFLVEYLWNEVVMSQPRSVRQFLMRTAILERFTAPLADALTGRDDGAEVLRELERANLFVVPLDRERVWYRYHHLFRGLLLGQLERCAPDLIPDLHRAASTWYADRDAMIEAIEHAIAAGDMHYAADELEQRWFQFYAAGDFLTLVSLMDRLSPDAIAGHPTLAVARAGLARIVGPMDEIEEWLQRVDPRSFDAPARGLATSIAGAVAEMRSMYRLAVGDVPGAIELGRQAVKLEPVPGSPYHATAGYHLGVALFFEDPDRARPLLQEFLTVIPGDEQDPRHLYAMALLAETHALYDELDAAERLAIAAMQATQQMKLEEFPSTNQLHIALGLAPLARGELDTAEEHFERAVTLSRRAGDRVEMAHALVWWAAVQDRQGDPHAGRDAFAAARELVPGIGLSCMRPLVKKLSLDTAPKRRAPPPADQADPLTEAELRVLRLMPGDLTYREMAGHLYLSLNTVRTHALRLRRKLEVSSRSAAVARARELGLL